MSWAHYLLQVNIYLIIFFCFYKLLLDKETYFILNRIYLIASGVLSITIPFLRFEWLTTQPVAQKVYTGVDQLSGFVSQVSSVEKFNWGNLTVAIYVCGIIFFICRFIYQLIALRKMCRNVNNGTAFSFLNKKVIAADVPELATINLHEEVHIKQKHTIDVLFFEFLAIFTWFNPIIYAYKHTVKNIHEFLADEAAAKFQGDKEMYSLLLLSSAFGTRPSTLTNGFFTKSLIKKRIFMLHKQRSKKTAILKYGLFVPLFALTLVLSSATIRKNNGLIAVAEQIPLNNIKNAVTQTIAAPLRIVEVSIAPKAYENNEKAHPSLKNVRPKLVRKDWYSSKITYPKEAIDNHIQGNVRVNFNVETGKINNIDVIGYLGYDTEQEVKASILAFTKELPAEDELPKIVISGHALTPKKEENTEDNTVYSHIALSNPPVYPGGMNKLYTFLGNTIKYPSNAAENNIQGTVPISFTVEKDGTLTDIKSEGRNLGYGIDDEAIRVMKLSKRWNPGMLNGKPARVKFNIPIKFIMPTEVVSLKAKKLNSLIEIVYIIDGKKEDLPSFNNLKPENIESVHVLKDAAAVARYGKQAVNGAIVITTKKVVPSLSLDLSKII